MKHKHMVVGMKVIAKTHEDLTDSGIRAGTEGVIAVLEPLDYTGDYAVQVDFKGKHLWLTADAIKPAEKEKRPFAVGDKVQEKGATNFDAGTVLTVIDVDLDLEDSGLPYLAKTADETVRGYRRADLRRVKNK